MKDDPLLLIGAKKRKNYGSLTTEIREASPVDSGFKETFTTSSSNQNEAVTTSSINQRSSRRLEQKRQVKKLFLEKDENLPEESKVLKKFLLKLKLVKPQQDVQDAIDSFNPKVLLCKTCINFVNFRYFQKLCLSNIIPKVPDVEKIEFSGVILHKIQSHDGYNVQYCVRWLPGMILDDEYVKCDEVGKLKKTLKISELNVKQKRMALEWIMKHDLIRKKIDY